MSQIQQVKDAVNIIDVIGQYIELRRSGTHFKGLCPFHGEKSPSFFVSEEMQRYKCFGCQETGDAFTFLEKYEGLTFYEALQYLAERAGITLETTVKSKDDEVREEVLRTLELASAYYHFLLTDHPVGEKARIYLRERGVTQDSIKLFQLGFSLDSWEGLVSYLHKKKKISLDIIEKAGLVIKGRTGSFYDRFRGRVMFPLKNHRGKVVGFSGRLLDSAAKEAKYINSPETIVYHKSQMLYGYSELLSHIRKENSVVLVEGEFDVISSTQAHINHVCAIKGSNLTLEHVKVIQRTAQNIILSLDTDSAGVKATKRAIEIVKQVEEQVLKNLGQVSKIDLRVAILPEGKDPDDLVKHNPKAWREAVKHPISAYEFLIQAAIKEYGVTTAEGKRKSVMELAPLIAGITHAVERDFYIKRVAELLDVSNSVIQSDIDTVKSGKSLATKQKKVVPEEKKEINKLARLEEYLFFLLIQSSVTSVLKKTQQFLALGPTQLYIKLLLEKISALGDFSFERLKGTLSEDLQKQLFDIYTNEEYMPLLEKIVVEDEWQDKLKEYKQQKIQEKSKEIEDELRVIDEKSEPTPDEELKREKLLQELVLLRKKT